MKIFILGVSGLIGHNILKQFSSGFEVFGTLHKSKKNYGNLNLFSGKFASNILYSLVKEL